MISDLDKIGLEAASVLSEAWTASAQARDRPLVEEIFAAFEEAKKNKVKIVINGAKGKTSGGGRGSPRLACATASKSRRDGTRKNEDTNRGSRPNTANLGHGGFRDLFCSRSSRRGSSPRRFGSPDGGWLQARENPTNPQPQGKAVAGGRRMGDGPRRRFHERTPQGSAPARKKPRPRRRNRLRSPRFTMSTTAAAVETRSAPQVRQEPTEAGT